MDIMNMFPKPQRIERRGGRVCWSRLAGLTPTKDLPTTCRIALEQYMATHSDWFVSRRDEQTAPFSVDLAHPGSQAYALTIGKEGICLSASDPAGMTYGLDTLAQILATSSAPLECIRIEDAPDFPRRGFMWDVSRCKVPTMKTAFALIDLLARLRFNELQLYIEHTFAFPGHEVVWKDASPFTPDEIETLDAYCAERHIELVPNLNSFGHMERWLRHQPYRHLAESPDGFVHPWGGPKTDHGSTLKPDADSAAFMAELYDAYLPHFRSRFFNIGCDETWELGQGFSRARCEEEGTTRVYLEFLQRICRLVYERGRHPQFWGDIILHQPELIEALPRPITAMVWGYEADHPWEEQCRAFSQSGIPFYLCPGTSTWRSLLGRLDNALANLDRAAANGLAHGAEGILLTDWGDSGTHQPTAVLYAPLVYAAGVCWNHAANRETEDLAENVNRTILKEPDSRLAKGLIEAARIQNRVEPVQANSGVFHLFLFIQKEYSPNWLENYSKQDLDSLREGIDEQLAIIQDLSTVNSEAALAREELIHALRMARLGVERMRFIMGDPSDPSLFLEEREALRASHTRLWRQRNREGGLQESCDYFDTIRPGL